MKQFIFMIDASGLGDGLVLMQRDNTQEVEHPVSYHSH